MLQTLQKSHVHFHTGWGVGANLATATDVAAQLTILVVRGHKNIPHLW